MTLKTCLFEKIESKESSNVTNCHLFILLFPLWTMVMAICPKLEIFNPYLHNKHLQNPKS